MIAHPLQATRVVVGRMVHANGVPGFEIPFYLPHPRLMKLKRQQMLEVEAPSLILPPIRRNNILFAPRSKNCVDDTARSLAELAFVFGR